MRTAMTERSFETLSEVLLEFLPSHDLAAAAALDVPQTEVAGRVAESLLVDFKREAFPTKREVRASTRRAGTQVKAK